MRLIVNQKNLKNAVVLVERVVARNLSLPILNNIVLKTENGRLKIIATNLEIGVSVFIGAKIEEVGEVAIPGRIFTEFISALPDEQITLSTKNNTVSIQSKTYKTHILGFETNEYPLIPKIATAPVCSIGNTILRGALLSVSDAMAVSDARAELAGVFMRFSDQKVTIAATDVFRLAEQIIPLKINGEYSIIVPRNTVTELIRVCGDISDDLTIKIGDNQISFSTDDVEFISRLIDGKYPDYKKVIPDKHIARAMVSRPLLEHNIRIAGLFSSSISDIKIQCEDKKMIITAKNSDRGEVQAIVPAIVRGDPFEMALNFHYLLDGLKSVQTETVAIEFTGQGSPIVVRPDDESKKWVYLIMPLRM